MKILRRLKKVLDKSRQAGIIANKFISPQTDEAEIKP